MVKVLVHDWLDGYGGAERVLTAINRCFKFDFYLCYADIMDKSNKEKLFDGQKKIIYSSKFLKKFGKRFRLSLPFFPYVIKSFNKECKKLHPDLVISSSWCLSKGFRVGNELHICYLQSRNLKYVWEEYNQYFPGIMGKLFQPFRKYLQNFDVKMAQNPDYLIANSEYVRKWVKTHYGRNAVIIYPPVDIDKFSVSNLPLDQKEYYITIGRLEPYKRFDITVKAFVKNALPLIVVGDGTQRKKLERLAKKSPNIKFVGYRTSSEINNLFRKAKAFVYAAEEDFGIVCVEAQASGTPVIALGKGGALETVEEGETGIYFYEQTAEAIVDAVNRFEEQGYLFDAHTIRHHAENFDVSIFKRNMQEFISTHLPSCQPKHLNLVDK